MIKKNKNLILVFVIFLFAFFLRIYGLNWDQGQHLHPDERFLTMVGSTIKLPNSIDQYFSTSNSPINPYNYKDYQFFVYGTFPLFLTKYIAEFLKLADYGHIHLVGRVLSAIFDSLNILVLYFLSCLIFQNKKRKYLVYLPSLLYCFSVLPIQLSHFFTVDTFLSFFILLTFTLISYFLTTSKLKYLVFSAISFGIGTACKISALYFLPVIFLFFFFSFLVKPKLDNLIKIFVLGILFIIFSFFVFRIFQPYSFVGLFKLNPQFIENINQLKGMSSSDGFFPPSVQWLSKTKLIFPLKNIFFWGIGLPVSLFFIFLIFKSLNFIKFNFRWLLITSNIIVFLSFIWINFLFLYQGLQFIAPMRYFLTIYPFIFLLILFLINLEKISSKMIFIILFFHIIFGTSFLSIYSRPHSRVQASEWIYKNFEKESKITNEYWDDSLPLHISGFEYTFENKLLPLYDPDSQQKWQTINQTLKDTNYILMTSNRLWGSIPKVSSRYPITTNFYNNLFDEKTTFKKISEINSYPGFSLPFLKKCYYFGPTDFPYKTNRNSWFEINGQCLYPGIYFRDDTVDESFTVYDHPKVLIFKNSLTRQR